MSLRSKIVLILVAVVGVYALVMDGIQRRSFSEKFAEIEREAATEDLERVVEALKDEIEEVDALTLRWSAWDDARDFLTGVRRPEFQRSNLGPELLKRQGIDLLYFLAPPDESDESRVVWGHLRDPESGKAIQLRDFPTGSFSSYHPLLVRGGIPRSRSVRPVSLLIAPSFSLFTCQPLFAENTPVPERVGLLMTELQWPLIVSVRPVLGSEGTGAPQGSIVLGRFLGTTVRQDLSTQTRVSFETWKLDGRTVLPAEVQEVVDDVTSSVRPLVVERDDKNLLVYGTFNDIRNRPEILLRACIPRDVTAIGNRSVAFGLVSGIAGGLVLLLALTYLLQRIVLSPLTALTAHALRIGKDEDFTAKLGLDRGDEIGTLSREFDRMMERLELAREQLVDTARSAGKSEIASGILHNVGNVLNSVNVSATLVSQTAEKMSVEDLAQVARVLEEHRDDLAEFIAQDHRGRHLQPFLSALSQQLGEERASLQQEIANLSQGIEHICELIKSQQSYAVRAPHEEELQLASRMEEALRITKQAQTPDPELEIVRDYDELPDVLADKHRLLEILVNLVQNARQALRSCAGPKLLVLRVRRHGEYRVRLEVEDTGPGMTPEVLAKVFTLGFTTKERGNGYGLHTAANAATEMGGSLTAYSDGPGRGSRFVLEIPLKTRADRKAAA